MAAAAATLSLSLMVMAVACIVLFLDFLLFSFLPPPADSRFTLPAALFLNSLLAIALWEVSPYLPLDMGTIPLFFLMAVILLAAPAAVGWMEAQEDGGNGEKGDTAKLHTSLPLFRSLSSALLFFLFILVCGALRELLGAGTLFRIQILPAAFSPDFGYGPSGIILSGLLAGLWGWRIRRTFALSMRDIIPTALTVGWQTLVTALPGTLLLYLMPSVSFWVILLLTAVTACLLYLLFPSGTDCSLTAGAILLIGLSLYLSPDSWLLLLVPLWTGALYALSLLLFGGLYSRMDNMHLPERLKTTPAAFAMVGIAMLGLSVLF